MSLPIFEVKLQPDRRLHSLILCSGLLCLVCGAILIAFLPVPYYWRALGGAVWLADGVREIRRFMRGTAAVQQISLSAGGAIAATSYAGKTFRLDLASGSFVTSDLAWLRLSGDQGFTFLGLFVRHRETAENWHRLQLIWLQARLAFGHPR